jgi:uncharacterized protein (TIRG00374 family)
VGVDSLQAFWHATVAFSNGLMDVRFGALFLAVAFHFTNLALRSLAWRNILVAAQGGGPLKRRSIFGAYMAGVGVNSVLPARGGDVMKVYLAHRAMRGAPYTTITSSLFCETLVDSLFGSLLLLWVYASGRMPDMPAVGRLSAFEWSFFATHARSFFLVLAVLLILFGVFFTWVERHVSAFWMRVKDGVAILRTPRRYLRRVALYQVLGWGFRVGSMYWFLAAFNIPASIPDALVALSAGSAATLLPLTPGGAGTQQAILVYLFRGVAPTSTVLSYSVGVQFTTTVANALAGGACISIMLRRLPWKTRVPAPGEPGAKRVAVKS